MSGAGVDGQCSARAAITARPDDVDSTCAARCLGPATMASRPASGVFIQMGKEGESLEKRAAAGHSTPQTMHRLGVELDSLLASRINL